MIESPKEYRFSSKAYHEMIGAGILSENNRVELINGEIIEKTVVRSRHATCVNKLNRLLGQSLQNEAVIISVQNPTQLSDGNEPEPDLAILDFDESFYANALPKAKDIHLIIEVAESSLDYDQSTKLKLYALAAIPELWIIDLNNDLLYSYQNPVVNKYLKSYRYELNQKIKLSGFGNLEFKVGDFIPAQL